MSLFASNDYVPATLVRLTLGAGQSNTGSAERTACLFGPILDDGYGVANTEYRISNEQQAIDYFGPGSPLHLACKGAMQAYKNLKLYAIGYAVTTDGETAATGTITITGTAAKAGQITVSVGQTPFTVSFAKAATASAIGDLIEAQVNQNTSCPATAVNVSGTVTLTAKCPGVSQNGTIKLRAIPTPGTNLTVETSGSSLGTGTGVAGADGSTTDLAGLTAALATIENIRYYYLGITSNAADCIAALETHITNKSEPSPGLRSVGIVSHTGSAADAEALALGCNYERIQLVAQQNSELHSASLLGYWLGTRAKGEASNTRYNFAGYGDWTLPRVYDAADFYTKDELQSGVANGVTLVQSTNFGSYLVKSVSCKSKNAAGTIDDQRSASTHIVSVGDEVADVIQRQASNNFTNYALMADQLLDDGVTVNPNQKVPSRTLTPSNFKNWLMLKLQQFVSEGKITNYTTTTASISSEISAYSVSRLDSSFELYVMPLLFQIGVDINEATAG